MSHALHRHGTTEQLQKDYTFYARASRYVNREGCGPKLRKILSIALSEKNLVNYGSSQAGKSYEAGLKPEEYAATLDKAYGVAGCFSDKETVRSFLTKLKEADTGISIVISGLIDEVSQIAADIGLKPHTAFLSLGVFGKRSLLPEDEVQQVMTMCGHGMVGSKLTRVVMDRVKRGKMTPEKGAHLLAQPCPCGIFNTTRCRTILEGCREKVD
jgi:hypothetical protein